MRNPKSGTAALGGSRRFIWRIERRPSSNLCLVPAVPQATTSGHWHFVEGEDQGRIDYLTAVGLDHVVTRLRLGVIFISSAEIHDANGRRSSSASFSGDERVVCIGAGAVRVGSSSGIPHYNVEEDSFTVIEYLANGMLHAILQIGDGHANPNGSLTRLLRDH